MTAAEFAIAADRHNDALLYDYLDSFVDEDDVLPNLHPMTRKQRFSTYIEEMRNSGRTDSFGTWLKERW